ncbi:MAG: CsbD family protein [Acidobacteriota bacterium]|nr:CsbD family protein [Acidobacteriota bacterium]
MKGKFDQVKGKVKQEVGKATGNADLRDEGVADEAGGELREGYGTAKRKVGEAIEDVGDAIKK